MLLTLAFFFALASSVRIVTLTEVVSTPTTSGSTITTSGGGSGYIPFSGIGHRLGGDRPQSQSRLLEIGTHRVVAEVVQHSDTVTNTLAQTAFQETVGVCTRASDCATATLSHFPQLGASGTANQAARQVVENIATTQANSVLGTVIDYAGPAVAIVSTGYELTQHEPDDYGGMATTLVKGFARFKVAAAAGSACASAAAPSAAINPILPALAGVFCAVTGSVATNVAIDTAASLVTSSVQASSVPSDGAPYDLDPAEWRPSSWTLASSAYRNALQRAEWVYDVVRTNEDPVVRARHMIDYIIRDNPRPENPLQPSQNAQLLLRAFVADGRIANPGDMTNSQWLSLLGNGDSLYHNVEDRTRPDQIERARSIADSLIRSGQRVVTLMDGHGRMVYNILCQLRARGENVDDYEFDIYDLDDDVNAWHARFLPASTSVHAVNIFRSRTPLRGIVYLNFCGIGSFVDETRRVMERLVGQGQHVFISFSQRGASPRGDTPLSAFIADTARMMNGPVNGISAQQVSRHDLFFTYRYWRA